MDDELKRLRALTDDLHARLRMVEALAGTLAKIKAGNDPGLFIDLLEEVVLEESKARPELRPALQKALEEHTELIAPGYTDQDDGN